MYNTGYSSQPIDFSRASQAMLNSALQMKVQEVKQRKDELSEAQKYMLKAMDMETIPEISGDLRRKFDEEINQFRDKTINLVKAREGRLTSADKAEIEKGAVYLQNRMNKGKLDLAAFAKAQDFLKQPNIEKSIDVDGYTEALGRIGEKLQSGEDVSSQIPALFGQYRRIPTEGELIKDGMSGVKLSEAESQVKYNKDGTATFTSTTDVNDLNNKMAEAILKEPRLIKQVTENGVVNPQKMKEMIDRNKSTFITTKENKRFIPRSGGSGSSSNPISIASVPVQLGNGTYTEALNVATPTAYLRSIEGAKDEFGNTVDDKKPRNFRLQGVSRDKNGDLVANIAVLGAPVLKKGEPTYEVDGDKEYAQTKDELKKKYLLEAQGKPEAKGFEITPEPEIIPTEDGGLDIIFTAVKKGNKHEVKNFFLPKKYELPKEKDEEKKIEFHVKPVIDRQSETFMTLPMNEFNKELISESDRKKRVEGTNLRLGEYLDKEMKIKKHPESEKLKSLKIDDDFSQYIVSKKK